MRFIVRKILIFFFKSLADSFFYFDVNISWIRKAQLRLSKFKFDKRVRIGHRVYFRNFGNISLGENCSIGSFSQFWNYSLIEIGENFRGAGSLTINTASHNPIDLSDTSSNVLIGKNVWCGINVTILGGVTIGDNVVIGAGSVVVKDIPSNCVAVGVPAKQLKKIDRTNIEVSIFRG